MGFLGWELLFHQALFFRRSSEKRWNLVPGSGRNFLEGMALGISHIWSALKRLLSSACRDGLCGVARICGHLHASTFTLPKFQKY